MALSGCGFTLGHGILTSTRPCVNRLRTHWRHRKDVAGGVASGDGVGTLAKLAGRCVAVMALEGVQIGMKKVVEICSKFGRGIDREGVVGKLGSACRNPVT